MAWWQCVTLALLLPRQGNTLSKLNTSSIQEFHNLHEGEACLLLCNGPSLFDLPIRFLNSYPSFGCNTIFRAPWSLMLNYYVAVDSRIMREFREDVEMRFNHIPKFFPTPNLDKWEAPNTYRFYHRPGKLWPLVDRPLWPSDILSDEGITYGCVPHVMMQLAYYMGFKTILIVGMDHRPSREHFWGPDEGVPNTDFGKWFELCDMGHAELYNGFKTSGVEMINLTPETQAESIPVDDWKKYVKKETER